MDLLIEAATEAVTNPGIYARHRLSDLRMALLSFVGDVEDINEVNKDLRRENASLREFNARLRGQPEWMARTIHPDYGPCDALGEQLTCSECVKRIRALMKAAEQQ